LLYCVNCPTNLSSDAHGNDDIGAHLFTFCSKLVLLKTEQMI